ncbi:hypothetical protein F0562_019069 [Nyssa sinensis]|uniref:Uncharacterized protein n=1 Tax=Nyssa sinensis TaxID=561372 RepID=A0A5J4ZBU5_9ASTE|nr:hypothetical protein F0562_019069 [Nyssa sinensis]
MGGGATLTPVAGAGISGGPPDPLTIPRPTSHHISSSHLNLPVPANSSLPSRPTCSKCSCLGETSTPLESVDGRKDKRASGFYSDSVFGPVPSRIEVQKAISDLQSFILGNCPSGSELDWLQRMLYLYDPRMMQSIRYRRVYDAFRLLYTDPSVQRMVVSLSSDKAVWDAVMKNKAVQDLRESLCTAKEERPQSSNEESDMATLILNWIFDIIKAKAMELIEKFESLVNELFQPLKKGKRATEVSIELEEKVSVELEEKLRSSLLLSIVILVIVIVTRSHGA